MKTELQLQAEIKTLQHQITELCSVIGELKLRQEHLRAAHQVRPSGSSKEILMAFADLVEQGDELEGNVAAIAELSYRKTLLEGQLYARQRQLTQHQESVKIAELRKSLLDQLKK